MVPLPESAFFPVGDVEALGGCLRNCPASDVDWSTMPEVIKKQFNWRTAARKNAGRLSAGLGLAMSSARGLLSVNALIATSLFIGFISNVVIAAVFGLTRAVDAYFAAIMLPNLFMILFVDFLGKNFLPVYALARKHDSERASELVSSIVTLVGLAAAGVAVVLGFFRHSVFGLLLPGFEAQEIEVVSGYFLIMTPAIVLMAITTFHEYVCQYDERYVRITTIQLLLPLANLIAVVALGPWLAETSLAVGYLVWSYLCLRPHDEAGGI